jgi:hypothetical protein
MKVISRDDGRVNPTLYALGFDSGCGCGKVKRRDENKYNIDFLNIHINIRKERKQLHFTKSRFALIQLDYILAFFVQ